MRYKVTREKENIWSMIMMMMVVMTDNRRFTTLWGLIYRNIINHRRWEPREPVQKMIMILRLRQGVKKENNPVFPFLFGLLETIVFFSCILGSFSFLFCCCIIFCLWGLFSFSFFSNLLSYFYFLLFVTMLTFFSFSFFVILMSFLFYFPFGLFEVIAFPFCAQALHFFSFSLFWGNISFFFLVLRSLPSLFATKSLCSSSSSELQSQSSQDLHLKDVREVKWKLEYIHLISSNDLSS